MKSKFTLTVAFLALCTAPALAQKAKGPALPGRLNVFAPQAYAVEPGIEAILMLTDEQKTKLADAYKETTGAPALQELGKKLKDKGTAEAERKTAAEQFKTENEKAQAEFKNRLSTILTAEQQLLIKKVDETVKNSIDGILSADQKEALAKTKKKGK